MPFGESGHQIDEATRQRLNRILGNVAVPEEGFESRIGAKLRKLDACINSQFIERPRENLSLTDSQRDAFRQLYADQHI